MNKTMIVAVLLCSSATLALAAGLSDKEKAFLRQDARGSAYELQLSQMAMQKSSNAQIRQFAQIDISDHATLVKEAEQIAAQDGMTLTAEPSQQDGAKIAMLKQQSGKGFDDAYVKAMKVVNQEDQSSFKSDAANISNPQLKQYMQHAADVDKKHKSLVQAIQVAY